MYHRVNASPTVYRARRLCPAAWFIPLRFLLNAMPRIGNQRHLRIKSRRRVGAATSSSKTRQGFFKKTIEATALGFVFLTVFLFSIVTFGDKTPAKATPSSSAAAAAGDHYPVGNDKRFTLDIPASAPPPPPPHMMLRGPRKLGNKRTSDDSNSSAVSDVTMPGFSLLEGKPLNRKREAEIVDIDRANAEAMKAAQAAVEAERAAVMAVTESAATPAGAGWEGGKAWDVSVIGKNAS